jgi:HD superfamily phosphodiesterase
MQNVGNVINAMVEYYGTDVRRINHFMKVFAFAKAIGESEGLDEYNQRLLEVTAVVHDIGIKLSEAKYNSSAGKYQEIEGPSEAEKLLLSLSFEQTFIDEVKFLVGHHHTYQNITTLPYQILVEADFIVNLYEDNTSDNAKQNAYNQIFKTNTGKRLMEQMYSCKSE